MERVLVTGATGFVGTHLTRLFLERGYQVRGTYRGDTTPARLDSSGRMEWIRIEDISPTTDWSAALKDVNYIVHLAALAHRLDGGVQLSDYVRTNAEGSRRLAEAVAAAQHVSRL